MKAGLTMTPHHRFSGQRLCAGGGAEPGVATAGGAVIVAMST